MSLARGTRVGPYEIADSLGAGGMGEVYRAHDTSLDRQVALKVLPDAFAQDADRLSRFEREAKTLAALNHPRIAVIHAIEKSGHIHALVMELVSGDDLSTVIARGPLSIDSAIAIADQIAEALEAAHHQGIIHRDLKPANVKVDETGAVKVLDFGIAKAMSAPGRDAPSAAAETITTPAVTMQGLILGTAAYMSPEQAKGKPVDRRTDVWAFGCVLFEMLSGRRAFEGEDTTDVIAAVITKDPNWSRLPVDTPPAVRRLLRRCLEKDRGRRLRDLGDARLELSEREQVTAPFVTKRTAALPWAVSAVLSLVIGALLLFGHLADPGTILSGPVMRMAIELPSQSRLTVFSDPAISPDGTQIAFTASDEDGPALWLRAIGNGIARKMSGTIGADAPFWSPDSREVAFFAEGRLKILDIDDASVQAIADAPAPRGGVWMESQIVFVPEGSGPLVVIERHGGTARRVLEETRNMRPFYPQLLHDNEHVIVHSRTDGAVSIVSVRTGKSRPVNISGGPPIFSTTGHLIYAKDQSIVAHSFDARTLDVSGDPVRIDDGGIWEVGGTPGFTISRTGVLVRPTVYPQIEQLTWLDRTGNVTATVGPPTRITNFSLSPNEKRLMVGQTEGATGQRRAWLYDLESGVGSRFAEVPVGLWTEDGAAVVVQLGANTPTPSIAMYSLSGNEERRIPGAGRPLGFMPDRSGVVTDVYSGVDTGNDIGVVPFDGSGLRYFLQTPANEGMPRVRPGSEWIAYVSDETGRLEVYLQSFPVPGLKRRVSSDGGYWPRWRGDGKELFFVWGGRVMSAAVDGSAELRLGVPKLLFTMPYDFFGGLRIVDPFEVSKDGQRFLTLRRPAGGTLSVLLNWQTQLPRVQ